MMLQLMAKAAANASFAAYAVLNAATQPEALPQDNMQGAIAVSPELFSKLFDDPGADNRVKILIAPDSGLLARTFSEGALAPNSVVHIVSVAQDRYRQARAAIRQDHSEAGTLTMALNLTLIRDVQESDAPPEGEIQILGYAFANPEAQ